MRFFIFLLLLPYLSFAQQDSLTSLELEEALIVEQKVKAKDPIAHENLSKEQIRKLNSGVDLPVMLENQVSVVATSDAGAGVGYTGLRIRGSDASRINITINGIPINDAESQQVFWVNMPDIASSASGIQIQRGIGTSSNGSGAFGASINLNTIDIEQKPFLSLLNTFGSFNTWRHNVQAGTGLKGSGNLKWFAKGRLSSIKSDGYIDRSQSDLKSYYVEGGILHKNHNLRVLAFGGKEITGQAWYGVPRARILNDTAGMLAYAANNGLSPTQTQNLLNSDRRYNHYLYKNQVDNYGQSHLQAHWNFYISDKIILRNSLHYTKGGGFYEEFQDTTSFSDKTELSFYGLSSPLVSRANIIRRRWLDNHFYGWVGNVNYKVNKTEMTLGWGWHHYHGKHFGEVTWANVMPVLPGHRYYDDDAYKGDFNVYGQVNQRFGKNISAWVDLQYRNVAYKFVRESDATKADTVMHFFNPKVGISFDLGKNHQIYSFVGLSHREPNRNDFVQSSRQSSPKAEQMLDVELGWRSSLRNNKIGQLVGGINLYHMLYRNELVLTGEVNDVGAYNRTNIPKSSRTGVELTCQYQPVKWLHFGINATFSHNIIDSFTTFIDNWDTWGQTPETYRSTPLSFSPNVLAGMELGVHLFANKAPTSIVFNNRFVGRQYLDNTGSIARSLDPYFVTDLRISSDVWKSKWCQIRLRASIRNIFNNQYESNGWVYRFLSGGAEQSLDGLYPQAGTHGLVSLEMFF